MFAIRDDREYVNQEDLTKAARKVGEVKSTEVSFLLLPSVTITLLTQSLITAKMEYST